MRAHLKIHLMTQQQHEHTASCGALEAAAAAVLFFFEQSRSELACVFGNNQLTFHTNRKSR